MDDFIAEIESAEEGGRDFDYQIECWLHERALVLWDALHYTTSLDAALTLVPEGWSLHIDQADNRRWFVELRHGFQTSYNEVVRAEHGSLFCALCIAALKARQASDNRGGNE